MRVSKRRYAAGRRIFNVLARAPAKTSVQCVGTLMVASAFGLAAAHYLDYLSDFW